MAVVHQLGNDICELGYVYVASSEPDAASGSGNQNADSASGPHTGSGAAWR